MQLSPRYGSDPVLVIDQDPSAIAAPAIAQRRRMLDAVSRWSHEWSEPSRCAGWTNRDVITHLDSTNTFWSFSIRAGLDGAPTEFLRTFDPVASPAELVANAGERPDGEVLEAFRASTEGLVALWESLDVQQWAATAEAPPGHLRVAEVVHHALWDSWVHERDVLQPLGVAQERHDDELAACVRYAVALGPALALSQGSAVPSHVSVAVSSPDLRVRVEIADAATISDLVGDAAGPDAVDAVELIEGLSLRGPLPDAADDRLAELVGRLAEAFDVERP